MQAYLNPETDAKMQHVVEVELLQLRQKELLEKEGSGCKVLLANEKSDDLNRMFRLFSRLTDGLSAMADIVKQHIVQLGNDTIDQRQARINDTSKVDEKETNNDPQFIKDLLSLHDKYIVVVNREFSAHSLFQKALKNAFTEFVNKDVGKYKNADLMSSFADRVLKTGGEKLSDTEAEEFLEKTVNLFSYLSDKDLFGEIYRNQLARRLLSQRSCSDEMERTMIGKLKLACGAQFTSKMEGMLNDLAIGAEQHASFDVHFKEAQKIPENLALIGKMELRCKH